MFDSSSSEEKFESEYHKKRYQELKTLLLPQINEITSQEDLIHKTKTENMIVHFYKKGFKFCNEMDEKLKKIIKDYQNIKFFRVNVEICPFVCEKLNITVLPFLGFFRNGFFVGQHIGFEKVGDTHCDLNKLKKVINESELTF